MKIEHKKEIFIICLLFLIISYLFLGIYYLNHSLQGVLNTGRLINSSPTIGIRLWMLAQSHLPGLFMVLAWISFTERKKILYVLFLILGLLDIYLTFKKVIVIGGRESFVLLLGYAYMIVLLVLVSFIYDLCSKKRWKYILLNISIFLAVAHREMIELVDFLILAYKNNVRYYELFIYMPAYIIRQIDYLTFKTGIGLETITKCADKYGATVVENMPDYFWFTRVFVFAAIILLNMFFGYEKRNKATNNTSLPSV